MAKAGHGAVSKKDQERYEKVIELLEKGEVSRQEICEKLGIHQNSVSSLIDNLSTKIPIYEKEKCVYGLLKR